MMAGRTGSFMRVGSGILWATCCLTLFDGVPANALGKPSDFYPNCTAANKQKALYLQYVIEPPLQESPALDISVEHRWNATSDMSRWGTNGVYAANPVGFQDGPSGYFGSQATGDIAQGGLLFSLWDKARKPRPNNTVHCAGGTAPNSTWCEHQHAFPLSPHCHRHCLDCGLHPGWSNTTGVQCSLALPIQEGQGFRFRLFRDKNSSTLHDPLGMGLTYQGSEWVLTATRVDGALTASEGARTNATVEVGRVFLEDTLAGVSRLGAFHEHIGCTPCDAFYESEIRRGPWIDQPLRRTVKAIGFKRNNCSCQLFDVNMLSIDGVPAAQFRTGPGSGP